MLVCDNTRLTYSLRLCYGSREVRCLFYLFGLLFGLLKNYSEREGENEKHKER